MTLRGGVKHFNGVGRLSNILRGSIVGVITGGLLGGLSGAFIGTVLEIIFSAPGFGTPMRPKTIYVAALIGLGVGAPIGLTVGGVCGSFLRRLFGLVVGASTGLLTLALGSGFLGWTLRGPGEPVDSIVTLKLIVAGGVVGGFAGAGLGALLDYGLERLGLRAASRRREVGWMKP